MGSSPEEEKELDDDDPFQSVKLARKRPVQPVQGHSLQPIAPAMPPMHHPGYAHPHHHHLPPPYPYMHHHPHPMHHHALPPHLRPPMESQAYSSPPPPMTAATPPSSGAPPRPPSGRATTRSGSKPAPATSTGESSGEPWLAAQNLTFLKRGSPPSEKKARLDPALAASVGIGGQHHHHEEIVSMPSLAESSQGTEPTNNSHEEASTAEAGDDTLLMAAMAMTEFAKT